MKVLFIFIKNNKNNSSVWDIGLLYNSLFLTEQPDYILSKLKLKVLK